MTMNESVNIQSKMFYADLTKNILDFKLNEEFCDVILVCEDMKIEVHKIILSTFSKIFKDILSASSNQNNVIYLHGVHLDNLKSLMIYMYTGEVYIPEERIQTFLKLTDDFKIKGLDNVNYKSKLSDINNSLEKLGKLDKNIPTDLKKSTYQECLT